MKIDFQLKKLNTNKFLSFIQATYPNPSMDGHPMRTHNELFERLRKNNNWPLPLLRVASGTTFDRDVPSPQ